MRVCPPSALALFALAALLLIALSSASLAAEETSAERDARMAWWREARFGMFIHWGVYAVPARGEWVMHSEKIPIEEYEQFVPRRGPRWARNSNWCAGSTSIWPDGCASRDVGAVTATAVAAVRAFRQVVGGEDAQPAHGVGIDGEPPVQCSVVAGEDLRAMWVPFRQSPGVRLVPPAVTQRRGVARPGQRLQISSMSRTGWTRATSWLRRRLALASRARTAIAVSAVLASSWNR